MKIAVAQLGNRMHYAVPEILSKENILSTFYTDIYSKSLIRILGNQFSNNLFSRLNNRRSLLLSDKKVVHYPIKGLNYKFELSKVKNLRERFAVYNKINPQFTQLVARDIDWNSIDAVYVFNSAAKEIILKAKQKGKKVILEQCIAPFALEQQIVSKEYDRYPDWNNTGFNEYLDCPEFKYFREREIEELNLADIILCPSPFVVESVSKFISDTQKLKFVPYGVTFKNITTKKKKTAIEKPLNILTVGAGIRKGTQYILEAAKLLKGRAIFTLLGDLGTNNIEICNEVSKFINFKGHVPKNMVHQYYESADIFLLPSLCEGSATVTYEAYNYGIPVIATLNTGALIDHGIDGLIIESSSTEAIVNAIEYIIINKKLEEFSNNALLKADLCSKQAYANRLISTINNI